LDSIRGPIGCDWKLTGRHFEMDVTIPANTAADVYVPAAKADDVLLNGDVAALSDSVSIGEFKDGCVVFRVGGGHYRFETGKR
jgi:alpha-L-rhamnosidase